MKRIFSMTLEDWNTFLQFASAVLLGLTFAGGAWAIWTGYVLGKRQEERIATAGRDASDANKKAAEAGEGTAKALAQVAEANARAAEANRIAEQERLARLQIEARFAHRKVSADQAKILKQELHNLTGHKITVTTAALQPEIVEYAKQIAEALRAAGLDASFQGALLPVSQAGLLLLSNVDRMQDAQAIAGAFINAGMATGKVPGQSVPHGYGELEVNVGPKE